MGRIKSDSTNSVRNRRYRSARKFCKEREILSTLFENLKISDSESESSSSSHSEPPFLGFNNSVNKESVTGLKTTPEIKCENISDNNNVSVADNESISPEGVFSCHSVEISGSEFEDNNDCQSSISDDSNENDINSNKIEDLGNKQSDSVTKSKHIDSVDFDIKICCEESLSEDDKPLSALCNITRLPVKLVETGQISDSLDSAISSNSAGAIKINEKKNMEQKYSRETRRRKTFSDIKDLRRDNSGTETHGHTSNQDHQDVRLRDKNINDNKQLTVNNENQSCETPEKSEHNQRSLISSQAPPSAIVIKKTKQKKAKETYSHVSFVKSSPGKRKVYIKFKYNEKEYFCEICSKKFKSFSKIKQHVHLKLTVNAFECEFCKQSYSTEKWYELHLEKCKRNRSCLKCKKQFKSRKSMEQHKCAKETVKECICDEEVPTQNHHEGVNINEVSDKCQDDIENKFQGSVRFKDKENTNLDQLPAKEFQDSVRFKGQEDTNLDQLSPKESTKHLNIQEDNGPYICDNCSKVFKNCVQLDLHFCIGKLFICDECGEKFHDRKELIVHLRSHSVKKLKSEV
ncbi:hypothetical protein C0J52_14928 [Blattella germanica]|nr:hypothetical protein C0J52_14928 [Blattella germanica]